MGDFVIPRSMGRFAYQNHADFVRADSLGHGREIGEPKSEIRGGRASACGHAELFDAALLVWHKPDRKNYGRFEGYIRNCLINGVALPDSPRTVAKQRDLRVRRNRNPRRDFDIDLRNMFVACAGGAAGADAGDRARPIFDVRVSQRCGHCLCPLGMWNIKSISPPPLASEGVAVLSMAKQAFCGFSLRMKYLLFQLIDYS